MHVHLDNLCVFVLFGKKKWYFFGQYKNTNSVLQKYLFLHKI
jgi:hypothetical protein